MKWRFCEALIVMLAAALAGVAITTWPEVGPIIACGIVGVNTGLFLSAYRLRRLYRRRCAEIDELTARSTTTLDNMTAALGDMIKSARPCPSCGFCQLCGEFHEERAVH